MSFYGAYVSHTELLWCQVSPMVKNIPLMILIRRRFRRDILGREIHPRGHRHDISW